MIMATKIDEELETLVFDHLDSLLEDSSLADRKYILTEIIAVATLKLEGIERLERRNGIDPKYVQFM